MKLTEHFTLEELTFSETAGRLRWDNTPGPIELKRLREITAPGMEAVRALLGHPVLISSGYRSARLNAEIHGSSSSYHPLGLAVDFRCPQFGTPLQVCEAIAASNIQYDQLIHEFGLWVHIGFAIEGQRPRGQQLTAVHHKGQTAYIPGLIPVVV